MSPSLFIGVDAGGTKSAARACLVPQMGEAGVRTFSGPGTQVTRDGALHAAGVVAALVEQARSAFGATPVGGVAVGLAGAGPPDAQTAVADALRGLLGEASVAVTHDADVALEAAFGNESGTVLIVGTGSMAYARRTDGTTLRAGGWGSVLGDDGSGTALGRAALRAVMAAWDGGPPTALPEHLAEMHGLADAPAVVAAAHAPGASLARFAPVLLAAAAADDWVATSALARETNALAQQVGWLATTAGDTVAPQLALAGGLAGEPVYAAALSAALDRHLPGWSVAPAPVDPAEGALAMALRLGSAT